MSRYHRSNQTFTFPKIENFQPPKSVEEFRALSYVERVHLRNTQPRVYERFTKESAKLFGDWRLE